MASVGALSARPQLSGARLNRSASKRVGKVSTVVRAEHKPGINMPEGDPKALNKWSRKITQPKSQGASQVRLAIPVRSSEGRSPGRSTGAARPARGDAPPRPRPRSIPNRRNPRIGETPKRRSPKFPAPRAHRRCSTPPASSPRT